MKMKHTAPWCWAAGALLSSLAPLFAQPPALDSMPERGVVPNGSYAVSKIETISTTTGNLSIHIPLASLPAGRAGLAANVDLYYNSSVYANLTETLTDGTLQTTLQPSDFVSPDDFGGWHYGFNYGLVADVISTGGCSPGPAGYVTYRLVMPDGSSHVLHIRGSTNDYRGSYAFSLPGCSTQYPIEGGNLTMYTADGTYLRMSVNGSSAAGYAWTLYFPDGRRVVGADSSTTDIFDANGNGIHITRTKPSGIPTTTLTDDFNRTITIQNHLGTSGQDTITQAGYRAQSLQWTVNWTTYTLSTGHNYLCVWSPQTYCDAGATPGAMTQTVVSSITLPTQQQYTFVHDASSSTAWGQLSQMTMPGPGAQVAYTYGPISVVPWSPASPKVLSKTLTWTDENNSSTRTESSGYSFTNTSSTFTNADGGITDHYFYAPSGTPDVPVVNPLSGLEYQSQNRRTGDVFEKTWALNVPFGTPNINTGQTFLNPGNPYVKTEFRSVGVYGTPALTSAKNYVYDRNGNQLSVSEYDWFAYGNITHGGSISPQPATSFSGGTIVRSTSHVFVNGAGNAISSDGTQIDASGYWNSLSPQLLNLVSRSTVNGAGPGSVTELTHDSNGNVTEVRQWDSTMASTQPTSLTASNAIIIDNTYDGYGNLTDVKNARSKTTHYTYAADANTITNCPTGVSTPSSLYISKQEQHDGDTSATTVRTLSFKHDCSSGALTSIVDNDHGSWERAFDYDKYGRNTNIKEGGVRETTISYDDANRKITTKTDLATYQDHGLSRIEQYDQLGRMRLMTNPDTATAQMLYITPPSTDTNNYGYSFELAENPTINPSSESTAGWTRTKLDTAGRVVEVKHFTHSSLPTPWGMTDPSSTGSATNAYDATCTTTTDEAGAARKSCVDGLGRLTSVTEDPGTTGHLSYVTSYGYDSLDNLTLVCQGGIINSSGACPSGNTVRSFSYSSLKRLNSATNPESGTISYTYDSNGNLLTKTDANSITTTFCPANITTPSDQCYSTLDQVVARRYSDGTTPTVNYAYDHDLLSNVKVNSVLTYEYTYDTIGRVNGGTQTTAGQSYLFNVSLRPFVGIDWIQYPNSNRKITTSYDTSGRPSSLTGQIGTGTPTTYASSIGYAPHGAINSLPLGNGLTVITTYNSRLQPTQITAGGLLTLAYCYRAADCSTTSTQAQNNGNVLQETITRGSTTWAQNYTYDLVNRLTGASESGAGSWSQTSCYDTRGNRWVNNTTTTGLLPMTQDTPQGTSCTSPGPYLASNRIIGWGYDSAGSITSSGTSRTFTYDAENRQKTAFVNTQPTVYTYDGDGKRVMRVVCPPGTALGSCTAATSGAAVTVFVYDPFGNLAQEYGSATDTVTKYIAADHLGSTRLETDSGGAVSRCFDYLPFGEELGNGVGNRTSSCFGGSQYPTSASVLSIKFTSKERDAETGLDFFGARYFSSAQGRFTSPDTPFAGQTASNPQSWNLYSYGLNNPLLYTDPSGQEPCVNGINPDNSNICTVVVTKADPRSSPQDVAEGAAKYATNIFVDLLNLTPAGLLYRGLAGHAGVEQLAPSNFDQARVMNDINLQLQVTIVGELSLPSEIEAASEAIARGHAFTKHLGEFPGVATQGKLSGLIKEVITEAKATPGNVRDLQGGRSAYWDDSRGIVVIHDPSSANKGTAFKPTQGKYYFTNVLK